MGTGSQISVLVAQRDFWSKLFSAVGPRTMLNPPRSSRRCQTVKSGRDLAGTTPPTPQISEIRTRFQHVP